MREGEAERQGGVRQKAGQRVNTAPIHSPDSRALSRSAEGLQGPMNAVYSGVQAFV